MRISSSGLIRPALAAMVLLGLASTRSDASPFFTVTDLGTTASSPSIPDSLITPRLSNTSGLSIFNPVYLGPGPVSVRAVLADVEGHYIGMGDLDNGDANSYASAINTVGQVVGRGGYAQGVDHGFLYTDHQTFDLNSLILPSSPPPYPDAGWIITDAMNIDDEGRILASGTYGGVEHTLLLEPTTVPEPTTLALFGLASAAALARSRRRRS